MGAQQSERRLAAILVCDVVSYSRLMQEDDRATIASLRAYREILSSRVTANGGRVVNAPGDSLLAEFPGAQSALAAAQEAQVELAAHNADLPAGRRMLARMGINLGEVIGDESGIYGDGVNVAARLQTVAEPGGIAISRNVYDLVERHSAGPIRLVGRRQFKNIRDPVEVYQVVLPGAAGERVAPRRLPRPRWAIRLGIAGSLAAFALLIGWLWFLPPWAQSPQSPASAGPRATAGKRAWSLDLPLPTEPFLAVLPFTSFGGDWSQEALADGFTETLITDLANVPGLLVVARNTMFLYKDRAVDPRELGKTLGVSHVLEGSVQSSGDSLRINAQLIDARNNQHLWAERFDAPQKDVFAVQDRIAQQIVLSMDVRLVGGELARLHAGSTTNLEAAGWLRRAENAWAAPGGVAPCENIEPVGRFYYRSVAADPRFASGWAGLARHTMRDIKYLCPAVSETALTDAIYSASQALELDPNNPEALAIQAQAHLYQRNPEAFLEIAARAAKLGGGNAVALATLAWSYPLVGLHDEAVRLIVKAIRIHPHYPPSYLNILGAAEFWRGNLQRAEEVLRVSIERNGSLPRAYVYLAAVHQAAGRTTDARAAAQSLRRLRPDLTVDDWLEYAEPYVEPYAGRLRMLLKAAGIP